MFFAAIDMNELSILLAAFFAGLLGIMGAFFKFMQWREKETQKERKQTQVAYDATLKILADSNNKVGEAMREVATATKQAASEAKQRNGHLGEQNIQITEMIASMGQNINDKADRNFKAFQNIQTQHVVRQTIDNAVIKDETVEHKED